MIEALAKVGAFLLEHADLVDDLIDVISSGTPKDAIRAALRAVKVKVSDEAMKEELGVK
jgi:hypothetical protein